MSAVVPFGATSLHDAIALTAKRVGEREGRRRAVVVVTDGADNASRLKPSEVAAAASEIDVPVYIFGIVPSIDNPAEETASTPEKSALAGPLPELATATGGHTFVASTPSQRSIAARQIVDELRHQYLIAFESSGTPGWHPLVVRARKKDLVIRARNGYIAGQSRPFGLGGADMLRKLFVVVPVAVLAIGGSSACATKKFVRTQVGEVNEKVDSQGRSIEETQERVRRNEGRISEVDQRAQAAAQSAQQANDAASAANTAAASAANAASEVDGKVDTMDKANRRLVYEVVLSEDQGNFKFGKTALPDEAKQRNRPDGPAAQAGSEERLHRDRRPHRQRRRQGHQRAASASSAPRR